MMQKRRQRSVCGWIRAWDLESTYLYMWNDIDLYHDMILELYGHMWV